MTEATRSATEEAQDSSEFVISRTFNENFPLEVLNILTLEEHDGKTTVSLCGGPHNATEAEHQFYVSMRSSMQQGFKGTFDQLEEYLAQAQA